MWTRINDLWVTEVERIALENGFRRGPTGRFVSGQFGEKTIIELVETTIGVNAQAGILIYPTINFIGDNSFFHSTSRAIIDRLVELKHFQASILKWNYTYQHSQARILNSPSIDSQGKMRFRGMLTHRDSNCIVYGELIHDNVHLESDVELNFDQKRSAIQAFYKRKAELSAYWTREEERCKFIITSEGKIVFKDIE